MPLLKKLVIENFRGFNNIELKDFSKLNIFLGKNNSGKTSILESIFLLSGMSNPTLPENTNILRGMGSHNNLKYLFYNVNFLNLPHLRGEFDDTSDRTLTLNPRINSDKDKISTENISSTFTSINGLDLSFSIKKVHDQRKTFKVSYIIGKPPVLTGNYSESISAAFIISDSKDSSTLQGFAELVKQKKENSILEQIQKFDNRIESIHALPDGIYFGIKGIKELVLSNMAGDGIRRYLKIISAIADANRNIILIDEIENGLHYSAYELLWKGILTITSTLDTQLFITTHNVETLKCLKKILETDSYLSLQNSVKVYTIAETKNAGFQAYGYSFQGLKDAIDNEIELRE